MSSLKRPLIPVADKIEHFMNFMSSFLTTVSRSLAKKKTIGLSTWYSTKKDLTAEATIRAKFSFANRRTEEGHGRTDTSSQKKRTLVG